MSVESGSIFLACVHNAYIDSILQRDQRYHMYRILPLKDGRAKVEVVLINSVKGRATDFLATQEPLDRTFVVRGVA